MGSDYNTGTRLLKNTEVLHSQHQTEIYKFLQQKCGDTTLDYSTFSHWSQRFCQGQACPEHEEHSGGLRTSTDNTMAAIIAAILEGDRCKTCDDMAMKSRISKPSVHFVLTEVLKKIMVTVHSTTTQDFILQKL